MKTLLATLALVLAGAPVWADARISVLMDVMKLSEVIEILREEGIAYGADLNRDMLSDNGGPFWSEQVRRLYDQQRMEETLRRALETELTEPQIAASTEFFASATGDRVVTSENTTRRAFADADRQDAALDLFNQLKAEDDPLIALVERYVKANALIENNVSGAMSEQFHFLKGMSDGGYYVASEQELLSEVWEMQDDITANTEEWLFGFLTLAYQPLPENDVAEYVAFAESQAGRALNSALFIGFDQIYRDISYGLGRAVALVAEGDEI